MKADLVQHQQTACSVTPSQRAHLLLYSHVESPCGCVLVCATNFGHLLLHDLQTASAKADGLIQAPACVLQASEKSGVYALATVAKDAFLAAGCAGRVAGYRWPDMLGAAAPGGRQQQQQAAPVAPAWQLELPSIGAEANSLVPLGSGPSDESHLAVGCGDGCVRLFDLGHGGSLVRTWTGEGRSPPVLRVAAPSADVGRGGLLAAADESGAVRLLDTRQRSPRFELRPARAAPDRVGRPALGDWLGCLACRPDSADWLACGGGPRLAIWHAANLSEPVAVASPGPAGLGDAFAPMCAAFSPSQIGGGDRLLAGGNSCAALQFSTVTGALVASSVVSPSQVMSVGCLRGSGSRPGPDNWCLVACGLGPRTDVCSSLGYRLFSLSV